MLELNVREARIKLARTHSVAGWDGSVEVIEVSITDAKAKELGYLLSDSKDLDERYAKDGSRYNGMYIMNSSCPVPTTEDEAKALCKLLGTDLIKLVKAKIKTEYQNKVRGFLNAAAESKKATEARIEKQVKQDKASEIKRQLDAGEIDLEKAFELQGQLL